ncbi:MAG TPA: PilZ domain-containing protein [Terriglobales bacterium]|nr:PilZ domain-containing protein [Terriglobales bacterium]
MNDVRAPSVPIGSALLVSNDPATIKRLSKSMQQFAISTEVSGDVGAAPDLLNRRKFGTIIVDLQLGDQARGLLEKVRHSRSNRPTVIFAISDSDAETAVAFKDGSNFVLRRPLSGISIDQSLRAAYGLILREQRRYFRCPVEVPATLRRSGMEEVRGYVVNISEGGIAIITHVSLKPGVEVQVQFTLPGHESRFAAKSAISWCREGYMGLQFISLSTELKTKLQDWLSRRLEQSLPGRLPANSEPRYSSDHEYAKA